jgi:hypothetical protein
MTNDSMTTAGRFCDQSRFYIGDLMTNDLMNCHFIKSLLQVGFNIIDMLNANRQA